MTEAAGWLVSLNEVEQLSAKAARGAGAGWGMAEEVALATRWMAERTLDWSGLLLGLLGDDAVAEHLAPVLHIGDLLSGARPGDAWRLEACKPVWALALLSGALHGRDLCLDCGWSGGLARLVPDGGQSATQEVAMIAALGPHAMTITAVHVDEPLAYPLTARARRSLVSPQAQRHLDDLATHTYVASSARSRAGAGGGRVDTE